MSIICGVDGCRGGWLAVGKVMQTGAVMLRREDRLVDLLYGAWTPAVTAVDIPIGLTDAGPRECDLAARRLLGSGRGSSVFPAPIRAVLDAQSYEEACRLRFAVEGKKISKQTYAILPKIREMDEIIQHSIPLRSRTREIHPEVSFTLLADGRPMQYSKRKPEGKRERRALLEPLYGSWLAEALSERRLLGCAEDDIVDAFVALWTAERIARGKAQTLPETPPKDRYGLRMEIVA